MPPTYSAYKVLGIHSDSIPKLLKLGYIPHGTPVYDGTAIYQAFILPVEKPSESKKIHESTEVENLIEKIKSSNNGYLFAPSESEIALAQKYPDVFYYRFDSHKSTFPHRISLK